MSVFNVGAECSVTFTGEDALRVAEMLRDWVRQRERSRGQVHPARRALADAAQRAAEGYAAERRRVLADFGMSGPKRVRNGQSAPCSATSEETWLPTEVVAQRLGITERHARRLACTGALRAQRAGSGTRPWRFDPAAVATWVPKKIA
ncbi:helix-turn-helix domain-containing protein [Amycolatopsis cynarae]|uniref:Helix-turn-helix domain-containing protein n=1 Tax=Amycolatopsis cynarae TaxID=2995223 RepID=A0ABY7B4H0_9PSEU|nr:helix-turn-helix domain-containing protein [Amycolatopsis sp. HUAS 11-8]WAL67219.1 helix-turn-helix domain-containing protein [Amycolatopsis sp. HUAS 11-8]